MHFITIYKKYEFDGLCIQKYRNDVIFSSFGGFLYQKIKEDKENKISLYNINIYNGFCSVFETGSGTIIYRIGKK